ncbi:MAG: S-layer homology domain-containing protein [Collinsella tanakaei]|nr:MAG: S-layer homology domain-containing protein [Collinsella tanakaei]
MPAAERTGYTLEGWEDNLTSTVYEIGADVVINADVTFTAQWDRNSSSGGGGGSGSSSYAVSVSSVSNGSVTVSPKNASKGATVTITVAPNEGYELGSLTVTDANGNRISLTNAGDSKYTFTMPSSKVTVTANFTAVEEVPEQVGSFTDVNTDDWFAEAVQYMLNNEMMNGTSATTFGPNTTTTRGMIVTILYRLEGEPDAAASSFTDVASNMYYADAINWAAANGIVNGITTTTFGPDNAITREQMAAILYRYAQFKGYDVSASNNLTNYTDASQISAYAATAMQWANAEGLIAGNTTTTINPTGNATRAEVATILMRFCENIARD